MKSMKAPLPLKKRIAHCELSALYWLKHGLCLSVICSFSVPIDVRAQITPDGTVNSQTLIEENNVNITGGTRQGNNLFHSFENFSLTTGEIATFFNDANIENIFTRVTGNAASNIDGILRAQGSANLFLLNPNGIIFGENAQLDIGGSFLGTTAESVTFSDGGEFNATEPNNTPVLTNKVPIGLGFGSNPGTIQVQGNGHQLEGLSSSASPVIRENSPPGLSVESGETIALVGGNVIFNGGILTAEQGRIEVGSVEAGLVDLNLNDRGLSLDYSEVNEFNNTQLRERSLLDASGNSSGSIQVRGENISFIDGSVALLQNQGEMPSGNLQIEAKDFLTLSNSTDFEENIRTSVIAEAISLGKTGDITINAQRILLKGGARIGANTYGEANGGNVVINATDFIQLVENPNLINSSTYASGDAGAIKLTTNELKIFNGGGITSSTLGNGNAGELNIEANNIDLISDLSQSTATVSSLSSVSFSPNGKAGNLIVDTGTLRVTNGGTISTASIGNGAAGNVTINAANSIEVSGQNNDFPSAISSAISIFGGDREFRIQQGIPLLPSGNAGNITINTPFLNINSGGEVSVKNQGTGTAGTLSINTQELDLDNSGSITAEAASGNGGNINLSANRIFLDNSSQITATTDNNGNGGNININTTFLMVKKNSDIIANAFGGNGGNITINTDTLTTFNSDITANASRGNGGDIFIRTLDIFQDPQSDITASSEFGIDGTVTIEILRPIDRDIILPARERTTEEILAQSCLTRTDVRGTFNVSPGSIPLPPDSGFDSTGSAISIPKPSQPLSRLQEEPTSQLPSKRPWQIGDPVVEATEVVQTQDGRTLVVAGNQTPFSYEDLICQPTQSGK